MTIERIHIINSGERICILFCEETMVVIIIVFVPVVLEKLRTKNLLPKSSRSKILINKIVI